MSNIDEDNFDRAFDLLGPGMSYIVQIVLSLTREALQSSLALPTQAKFVLRRKSKYAFIIQFVRFVAHDVTRKP